MKVAPVLSILEAPPKRQFVKLIIFGEHDLGRVDFATSFPNSIVVDASGSLCAREDKPDIVLVRTNKLDAIEKLIAGIVDGQVAPDTLVIDGFSFIAEAVETEFFHIKSFDNYHVKNERYGRFVAALRTLPCNLVIITRAKQETARPNTIFGGRLVTDMERVILGTSPEAHKTLLEYCDVSLEIIRGGSGRPMVAVKTSVLRDVEVDEVLVPDPENILARLTANIAKRDRNTSTPTAAQYGKYLRVKNDAIYAGIGEDRLTEIRRLVMAAPDTRTSPYPTGAEIDAITNRLFAFLAGEDPLTVLEPDEASDAQTPSEQLAEQVVAETHPTNAAPANEHQVLEENQQPAVATAKVTIGQSELDTSKVPVEETQSHLIAHQEPASATESNVVPMPTQNEEIAAPPSPKKPEWQHVKSLLETRNSLLEQLDRSDEIKHTSVVDFLREFELYTSTTAGGLLLTTTANAQDAARILSTQIDELTPLVLPVAS